MTEFVNAFGPTLMDECWPYEFKGTLQFTDQVRGGTPSDPNKALGWLRSKIEAKDDILAEMVAKVMQERGLTSEEAVEDVNKLQRLNGFRMDENGLYLEGRCLKAALKEACVIALSANKIVNKGFGMTAKSLKPYLAEHVMVEELRLYLMRDGKHIKEADGIDQRFTHTFYGSGISYEEYVEQPYVEFTIKTDHPFTRKEWGTILLTGGEQGLGSTRSMGYGRYVITKFEQTKGKPVPEKGSSSGKNVF